MSAVAFGLAESNISYVIYKVSYFRVVLGGGGGGGGGGHNH